MLNKKVCILLTNGFPFPGGEPFLASEISFLASGFDRVLILAIGVKNNEVPAAPLSENVKAIAIGGTGSRLRYLRYLIKGLLARYPVIQEKSWRRVAVSLYVRGRAWDVYRRCRRILEKEQIKDCSVLIYSYWFTYQALAACLLKQDGELFSESVSGVSRAHGYDLYWYRSTLGYLPFQGYCLEHLDRVFTCSKNGSDYLIEKNGKAIEEKVEIARLGTIDHGLGHGVSQKAKTVVTCCNFSKVKRMNLFAKAFANVCSNTSGCRWLCIGSGDEYTSVMDTVIKNGIQDRVVFYGNMSNEEVLSIYSKENITCFCNVSESEGVPVSVMEAQSFGIPVIATDVGGTSEIVNDANGILLPKEITENEIADSIRSLFSTSELEYAGMSASSRECWQKMSSAESNYSGWMSKLNDIISNNPLYDS